MKRGILKISNYNIQPEKGTVWENLSVFLAEGEIVGALGLMDSGKDDVIRLLCGESKEELSRCHVIVEGKRIQSAEELKEKVYRIKSSNYMIEEWTAAEYIGLEESGWLQTFWVRKRFEENIRDFVSGLEVEFDVTKKVKELSEQEKRIMDVLKAIWSHKKILVIEDEFEEIPQAEISIFSGILHRLIQGRMAVLLNSYSDAVQFRMADRFLIFAKNHIIKKCPRDHIKSRKQLEAFLFGNTSVSNKKSLDSYISENHSYNKKIAYQVSGIGEGRKTRTLTFTRGEVVTFLVVDRKKKEKLFLILSGRRSFPQVSYQLDGEYYAGENALNRLCKKVVSVPYIGERQELFPYLSVGENLLIPSLSKISSGEYIWNGKKLLRMFRRKMKQEQIETDSLVKDLGVNDSIHIVLEKLYIYNPRVLVLLEPFIHCDMIGVSIIKSYIKKIVHRGTLVIIIKSRDEYTEDISDQIITIS